MKGKLLIVFLLMASVCKAGSPLDAYIKGIKKVLTNCTMKYDMTCMYPNDEKVRVKGIMGVKGDYYYDSSNVRFIFLNDKWYLAADHAEKQLALAYVPTINKKLKGVGSLSMTSYLFNDESLYDSLDVKVIKEEQGFIWIELLFPDNDVIKKLEMKLLKEGSIPLSYNMRLNYPVDGLGIVKLDIKCFDIKHEVPNSLFDHKRLLVQDSNKKVKLKKFTSYKYF